MAAILAAAAAWGCQGRIAAPFEAAAWHPTTTDAASPASALGVLNWVAGLAILGGLIAMTLTRGAVGWRAAASGVLLVMTSFALSAYPWLAPMTFITAGISAIVCWYSIKRGWRLRTWKHS